MDAEEFQRQKTELEALAAETLDPEFADWMEDGPFGPAIKHPLVYDFTPQVAGIPNRQLRYKKAALARAIEQKDWHTVVFLHERPWRADALLNIVADHDDEIADADYWKLVGSVWIDS